MAVTHQKFVDLMAKLVEKNGRTIQIRRQTGTTPKVVGRPELGSIASFTNTPKKVVFLDADSRDLLLLIPGAPDERSLIQRDIDRFVALPAKGLSFEVDLATKLVDGDKVWEITQVNRIQPGPTLIGYFLRVSN